jgi:hypothetical protein
MGKPKKTVHDYWFKLQFKLKWKDAPKTTITAGAAAAGAQRR